MVACASTGLSSLRAAASLRAEGVRPSKGGRGGHVRMLAQWASAFRLVMIGYWGDETVVVI
eukprot:11061341-Alexandrium_andersonii.AAC.1